jgi:hypothetical protein
MGEDLFWAVTQQLQSSCPGFGTDPYRGSVHRFKRSIHIADATVIQLVSSCVDWANHNRRKAAAKCHLRLSLRSLLPAFAVIETAREGDVERGRELCAGLKRGEVVLYDRAYHDLAHFRELTERGVFFVTRTRSQVRFERVRRLPSSSDPRILADEEVRLCTTQAQAKHPATLRRVRARVEIEGEECELEFLTNNFKWSAASVADLYRCRWAIEAFFKQIKQTLQLSNFVGHSANAVKWQIWMALLVYVLVRFQAWMSRWPHSFSRLVALLRAGLWLRRDLPDLLRRCGTASGSFHFLDRPRQTWLPNFIL